MVKNITWENWSNESSSYPSSDFVTGVYVGKFGDIYYENEVISLFKKCYSFFNSFKLIVATPKSTSFVKKLKNVFPNAIIRSFNHDEIPNLLSKCDFGFAPLYVFELSTISFFFF